MDSAIFFGEQQGEDVEGNLIMGPSDPKREVKLTLLGLQKQLAEAKCFHCNYSGKVDSWDSSGQLNLVECESCQGTGLRWPTLFRKCGGCLRCSDHVLWVGSHDYIEYNCDGSGRVLDVTLEKVRELLHRDETQLHSWRGKDGVYHYRQYAMDGEYEDGVGTTELEAACMTLLET